jgi:hypothetical protein
VTSLNIHKWRTHFLDGKGKKKVKKVKKRCFFSVFIKNYMNLVIVLLYALEKIRNPSFSAELKAIIPS